MINYILQTFALSLVLAGLAACHHGGLSAAQTATASGTEPARQWAKPDDYRAQVAGADRLRDLTGEWETPHTPILANFHNLYNPRIVEEPGADYPFKMWFFGWAVADSNPTDDGRYLNDAIYHARSRDLLHWEVYTGEANGQPAWDTTMDPHRWAPVMTYDQKVYDNAANGDPSVVRRDGTYYMAFSSVGQEVTTDSQRVANHIYVTNCVMGARSSDGIHWEKTAAPILIWDQESSNRWDIAWRDPATPPVGYQGSYHRPSLLWDEGRWKVWFDYMLPGTFLSLGYAENSGDFMNPADWHVVRAGDAPLLKDWPNPNVIKVGAKYYAFSDAPGYDPMQLGGDGRVLTMAESDDGLTWRVLGHLSPEGLDAAHVPEAFLHKDQDGATWLYVFYAWKPQSRPGAWDYRYKQIRYMRKRVG